MTRRQPARFCRGPRGSFVSCLPLAAFCVHVRAIGIHQPGDFDVIRDLQLPFPAPAPDQLLIKVEYGGVNFIDTYFRCAPPAPVVCG
jgi:hypothetical protein